MEMREPGAHKIAREAAACWADIDETIPVLLGTMVLGEMADIGRTLPLFSRRAAKISRHTRSGKDVSTVYPHLPLAGEFCAGLDETGVD